MAIPDNDVRSQSTHADEARVPKPRLVFMHSRASGPARQMDSLLATVLQGHQNHETFLFQRVIVEDHSELAERFRVNGVPTLFVIEHNRVQARIEHPCGRRELKNALQPWLRGGS
jgi:thioredoxin-like negative regulator of GroEL